MKLATLRNGTRDGRLAVVSRDLRWAMPVPEIAPTLQAALDDWPRISPLLQEVCDHLAEGYANGALPFDQKAALAPLPRAHHWVDGSAYVNHVELVRKARNADMPPSFWTWCAATMSAGLGRARAFTATFWMRMGGSLMT